MTATLFNHAVLAAADQVASLDHISTECAHDVVSATAPLQGATTLREIAAAARQTVNTSTGCYRIVRADDLLKAAAILESDAVDHLRVLRAEAADRDHVEALEIDRLRAEVTMLRQLIRCDYIGEHPLTADGRARVEAETRATWAAIALAGGA
jgi:hypothetical protein